MSFREEQCQKVCRILDDVLANRPTERDSLIVAVQLAFEAQPEPLKIDLSGYSKEDWERFRKEWANVPIMALPKRGRWIYHIDDLFPAESTMECNQCHAEQPLTCDDEFCPHCGAKMEVTT